MTDWDAFKAKIGRDNLYRHTHHVDHVTGYAETTEDGPGEPIIEHLTVTRAELAELLGSDSQAETLIQTGSLGQHDEWAIAE